MIRTGPGILLTTADCAALDRQLIEALRRGYLIDGRTPPSALVDLAAQIHECADLYRRSQQVTGTLGTGNAAHRPRSADSAGQPATLTVKEAAISASISETYMRRLARQGAVYAVRAGRQGAWVIDAASLTAWTARRADHDQRKAS